MRLVNAGLDGYCNTTVGSGDIITYIPTTPKPEEIANYSVKITAQNYTIQVKIPFIDLEHNTWYCLQMDSGVIQDLAGNVFVGIQDQQWKFQTAWDADVLHSSSYEKNVPINTDSRPPTFFYSDPPSGSYLVGNQGHKIRLIFSENMVLADPLFLPTVGYPPGVPEITFTPDSDLDEVFRVPFTPEPGTVSPNHVLVDHSVVTIRLNRTLKDGVTYDITMPGGRAFAL